MDDKTFNKPFEKQEEREERNERNEGLTTSALAGAGEGTASTSALAASQANPAGEEPQSPLFSQNDVTEFRGEWDKIQAAFVDEPRQAVERADNLVAVAMKRMAEMFAEERAKLEGQWDRGDNVSTEDLRVALRRYRSFFNRLLNM